MSPLVLAYDLLSRIGAGNREIRQWQRRAEIEVTIAVERIEIARLLADVASWQLRLAALDQGPHSIHPELQGCQEQLRETLMDIFREEMCCFWERTEDGR